MSSNSPADSPAARPAASQGVQVGAFSSAEVSGIETLADVADLVDFVAAESDVVSVDAREVMQTLAGVDDVATVLLHVHGEDEASVIAGQTLAIGAGVRHLVAGDVRSTRRVAVLMSQVLQAS